MQEAPFAVQVELTEGCNLRCSFCGIKGIREKAGGPFKFMTVDTAKRIAEGMRAAKWTARVEFAMHGEPTLNPDMIEIVRIFRQNLPKSQLMITSNGGGLIKSPLKTVRALLDAGLNVLALDDYKTATMVPRIVAALVDSEIKVVNYPADGLEHSPHRRGPVSERRVVIIQDISDADEGSHASLNNHCGTGSPLNDKGAGKRCAKPFREMSIRWDGRVSICCNDWRGRLLCGDVTKQKLVDVWNSRVFQAARKYLYHGMRDFAPCKGCDALSYRVGLLPDKKGKEELPRPDKKDAKIIADAQSHGFMTAPVRVPWEDKKC